MSLINRNKLVNEFTQMIVASFVKTVLTSSIHVSQDRQTINFNHTLVRALTTTFSLSLLMRYRSSKRLNCDAGINT